MIENGIEMRGSLTLSSTSGADIQIEDYTDLGYSAATKLGVAVQGGSDDVVGGSMSVGSQASAGGCVDGDRLGPERGLTGPGGPGCAPEPSRGGGEQPDHDQHQPVGRAVADSRRRLRGRDHCTDEVAGSATGCDSDAGAGKPDLSDGSCASSVSKGFLNLRPKRDGELNSPSLFLF